MRVAYRYGELGVISRACCSVVRRCINGILTEDPVLTYPHSVAILRPAVLFTDVSEPRQNCSRNRHHEQHPFRITDKTVLCLSHLAHACYMSWPSHIRDTGLRVMQVPLSRHVLRQAAASVGLQPLLSRGTESVP
jgi:hypothetical protein